MLATAPVEGYDLRIKGAVAIAGAEALNTPDRKEIGQLIRHHRRARKMSLQDVSKLTGISISTISKLENNAMELSYTRMMAISEALGVNLTELVSGEDTAVLTPPVTARRSITRAGQGDFTEVDTYIYEYVNTDISKKRMVPTFHRSSPRGLGRRGCACRRGICPRS